MLFAAGVAGKARCRNDRRARQVTRTDVDDERLGLGTIDRLHDDIGPLDYACEVLRVDDVAYQPQLDARVDTPKRARKRVDLGHPDLVAEEELAVEIDLFHLVEVDEREPHDPGADEHGGAVAAKTSTAEDGHGLVGESLAQLSLGNRVLSGPASGGGVLGHASPPPPAGRWQDARLRGARRSPRRGSL